MKKLLFVLLLSFAPLACNSENSALINAAGDTVETRFLPPKEYSRKTAQKDSFESFLRALPLKPHGSAVKFYNGMEKPNLNVYCAVVDMTVSKKDLQQCADAVMRLRGEWLYSLKKYAAIKFNFVSDGKPRYFKDYAKGDYSYAKFLKYMDYIFAYANTTSLYNELKPVNDIYDMQTGDVFIQKGRPYGHAVIVLDMAENKEGKKVYLLAQSYMPAQETQVLINPVNSVISPWYELNEKTIETPEWTFEPKDLRRF